MVTVPMIWEMLEIVSRSIRTSAGPIGSVGFGANGVGLWPFTPFLAAPFADLSAAGSARALR
jgi:hypothetical protein